LLQCLLLHNEEKKAMTDNGQVGAAEVGRRIAALREQAGIKQVDLARLITWSSTVLSRVESGEREIAPEELSLVLDAIGTPEAKSFAGALSRNWQVLSRPALDHPDHAALWDAELVARDLQAMKDDPDVRSAFQHRLAALLVELHEAARRVMTRQYQVVFIGGIGIGKSTAICRVTALEVTDEDRAVPVPVLEAGAGGITLCEVHVRAGPRVGIIVEPRREDDIRADVFDFAEYLRDGSPESGAGEEASEGTEQGVSREVERAIRNMTGLRVRRKRKDADGNRLPTLDEARELANGVASTRELAVELLSRMALHRRDRRDIWYDVSVGKGALTWLKDSFEAINNGKHPEFTLPKRIDVVTESQPLGVTDVDLRLVDTKGVDGATVRADLEAHFDDPHTVIVLCSRFNDAPAEAAQRLLERARDAGMRGIEHRALLLVLPHTGEALEIKDEEGSRAETIEDGYELKQGQIELQIRSKHLPEARVGFFNARDEAPERLRGLILGRVTSAQTQLRDRLKEVTNSARAVLGNHELEQVQAVQRAASRMLRTALGRIRIIRSVPDHVHQDLLDAIQSAHWSTVRAAVRREGEWANLSYTHHLGYGARRVAVLACGEAVAGFTQTCETMAATADYDDASDLISQAERTLQNAYDEMLRKIQLMGQTMYSDELRRDIAFWTQCGEESGRGYKQRIFGRNEGWFGAESRGALESHLRDLLQREWNSLLATVEALLEPEVATAPAVTQGPYPTRAISTV
jgi:transcriptional regulator with XRE-family HTH domain